MNRFQLEYRIWRLKSCFVKYFFNKSMHLILRCRYRFDKKHCEFDCVFDTNDERHKRFKWASKPCKNVWNGMYHVVIYMMKFFLFVYETNEWNASQFVSLDISPWKTIGCTAFTFCFLYAVFPPLFFVLCVDVIFFFSSSEYLIATNCNHLYSNESKKICSTQWKHESHPIIQYMLIN